MRLQLVTGCSLGGDGDLLQAATSCWGVLFKAGRGLYLHGKPALHAVLQWDLYRVSTEWGRSGPTRAGAIGSSRSALLLATLGAEARLRVDVELEAEHEL